MYGMGANLMSQQLKVSFEECQEILKNFYEKFPKIKEFVDGNAEAAKEQGYVEDYLGRRRHLPDAQLPEVKVTAHKKVNTNCDLFLDCQSNDTFIEVEDKEATKRWTDEYNANYAGKGFKTKTKFKDIAKANGISVLDNGAFISKTMTQCTNARIQGCLSGSTRIQTKDFGIVPIRDVCGQTLKLWDGYDWTTGSVIASGKKQKCIIYFTDGSNITCSPNHKFLMICADGSEKFKECKDIKHYERVLINQSYTKSDFIYNSDNIINEPRTNCKTANAYYLDDIINSRSSFDAGRFIGRLASDGSYGVREDGGSSFTLMAAEHEFNILPILESYVSCWPKAKTKIYDIRAGRTQRMANIGLTSWSLLKELVNLNLKHEINNNIFMDTELLRGFISGFYDGDGGISGNNISLTFGVQYDFEPMIKDIQIALKFLGIRSRYHKYTSCYRLSILRADSQKFAEVVGFINYKKQQLAENMTIKKDLHCFNSKKYVIVDRVEITNEFIDMYDVCDTDRGYFVADGLITHNSASSLTKKAMVNIFKDSEMQRLGFKLLIPVHDELLGECPLENAEEVSERLAYLMSHAAQPEVDAVPFVTDPYVLKRWYADEMLNEIQEYISTAIEKEGKTREQAIAEVKAEHTEFSDEVLNKFCDGTYDVLRDEV